jgi:glycosyltransferase involved in cell wall biosynthesis
VSPSAFESFSIALMEAWTAGTPALVNSRCGVTLDHVRRSGGGLAFGNYAELEVELDRLTGSAPLRASLGRAGQEYVEHHYRWDDVIDRYAGFLEGVAARVAQPRH